MFCNQKDFNWLFFTHYVWRIDFYFEEKLKCLHNCSILYNELDSFCWVFGAITIWVILLILRIGALFVLLGGGSGEIWVEDNKQLV